MASNGDFIQITPNHINPYPIGGGTRPQPWGTAPFTHPPLRPYTPPAQIIVHQSHGVSEDRLREIIREELRRALVEE